MEVGQGGGEKWIWGEVLWKLRPSPGSVGLPEFGGEVEERLVGESVGERMREVQMVGERGV